MLDVVVAVPALQPVLDEHLADFGEVMSHLLLRDCASAGVKLVSRDRRTVATVLDDTERAASSPDANIANVVDVCGPMSPRRRSDRVFGRRPGD
jgi:hypothetical protein